VTTPRTVSLLQRLKHDVGRSIRRILLIRLSECFLQLVIADDLKIVSTCVLCEHTIPTVRGVTNLVLLILTKRSARISSSLAEPFNLRRMAGLQCVQDVFQFRLDLGSQRNDVRVINKSENTPGIHEADMHSAI
jgi:hypothetical protein